MTLVKYSLGEGKMNTYEVTLELIVHVPVKVIVEADSPGDAIDGASDLLPMNIHEAHEQRNKGWRASVNVKPPKGVVLSKLSVNATYISVASGNEKARKVKDKVT
jgi:hypothetical protein